MSVNADGDFFFHGASIQKIEELIEYKNAAVSQNPNVSNDLLSPKFKPLNLSEKEKADLVQFLKVGISDPDLARYVPTEVLSGKCFPNADPQSSIDLGCN